MIIILYIAISIFILFSLHRTEGLKAVLWLYIAAFILLGGLNKAKYSYFLEPADWFTLIIFGCFFIYGLAQKREYTFEINWPDILLLFYFTFTIYMPMIINLQKISLNPYSYFTFFMPMRIWFVYRIFFYAMSEAGYRKEKDVNFDYIINAMLFIGSISALIAMLRYFPIPYVQDFIEDTWPIITNGRHVSIEYCKRLVGTMSAINGTGSFFAFLIIFSLYKFNLTHKSLYIVYSILFFICLMLSGSFSSICAFLVGAAIFYKKYIGKRIIGITVIIAVAALVLIYQIPIFSDVVTERFTRKFQTQSKLTIIPNNLEARLSYWRTYTNSLMNKHEGIYGFGPGGMRNDPVSCVFHGNPESFYFRLLGDSGFIGLLAFIVLIYYIFRKLKLLMVNTNPYKEQGHIIKIIIIMFLVAGVANQTLYYGGNTEIFSIILAFLYILHRETYSQKEVIIRENDRAYLTS